MTECCSIGELGEFPVNCPDDSNIGVFEDIQILFLISSSIVLDLFL